MSEEGAFVYVVDDDESAREGSSPIYWRQLAGNKRGPDRNVFIPNDDVA